MDKWFGVGFFIWMLGFITRFLISGNSENIVKLPKWMCLLYLSLDQKIPVSNLVFQTLGYMFMLYSVLISKQIEDPTLNTVLGILIPVIFTKLTLDMLQR
jgi:uncharacterized protein YacL